jgi:hypothetical protein
MPGQTVCNFALGVTTQPPFHPRIERLAASHALGLAEILQQIATGLGRFEFSNFSKLVFKLDDGHMLMQTVLLYEFLQNKIRVEVNDDLYWYEIIIPEEPNETSKSLRPILTEEEVLKVEEHRIKIVNIFRKMAFVPYMEEFVDVLLELKVQLVSLHVLDYQARFRHGETTTTDEDEDECNDATENRHVCINKKHFLYCQVCYWARRLPLLLLCLLFFLFLLLFFFDCLQLNSCCCY